MSREARLQMAMAGLHPGRARDLMGSLGSAEAVVRAVRAGKVEVSRRARAALAVTAGDTRAMLAGLDVRAVLAGDPGYPVAFGDLGDAPDVLFVRGSVPAGPAVAVVGTRRCTGYGRSLARAYGAAIAAAGWVTVSGLARGIDAEAHRGALDNGGAGVAVLGSGSNRIYPPEHRGLHDRLLVEGAVITEYPPGTPPEPWRFPPRNRLISGLSRAVVVVEAAVKGGALITAGTAAEQGRAVLAVPGDVGREASEGCNLLIRDGAIPVLGPDDLIEALSLIVGPPRPAVPGPSPTASERAVLDALGAVGSGVEALVAATGRDPGEVLAVLARLEAAGRVVRVGSRLVARTGPPSAPAAGASSEP